MKPILNTILLLSGLFALTAIKPHAQTITPSTCVWVSQTQPPSTTTSTVPSFVCMDTVQLSRILPASAPATSNPVQGGTCAVPQFGLALYAQDPVTHNCYPIITVPSASFVAKNSDVHLIPDHPEMDYIIPNPNKHFADYYGPRHDLLGENGNTLVYYNEHDFGRDHGK